MLFNSAQTSGISSDIIALLREHDYRFEILNNGQLLKMGIAGENSNWQVYVALAEKHHKLQIRCVSPIKAPLAKQAQVAELITRLNYTMSLGNLEMDYTDGEIAFKISHFYPTDDQIQETFYYLFITAQKTFNSCLAAILAVVYGGQNPAIVALETDF